MALHVNGYNVTCYHSFGLAHIPKEIKKFIGNKNIKGIIYRIQVNDSRKRGYICIGFINFMLRGKSLL